MIYHFISRNDYVVIYETHERIKWPLTQQKNVNTE